MFYLCESEATATMFYLRESEASAANVLSVAKAKRQLQSAQSERKSTTRYGDDPIFAIVEYIFIFN
ncbi:hypothetical protein [Lysinibacillus sphaericus]|uniref:hypothetical protein n=2 Tax=Bacillaceae TaxID=186817 RepID=UPI001CBB27AA|nr:hypothetical protein [Lysinibacillus sphaericus]